MVDRNKLDWHKIANEFHASLKYNIDTSTSPEFASFMFGKYKPTLEEVAECNGYVSGLKVANQILMNVISCQIEDMGLLGEDETFEEDDIFPEEADDEE